MVDEPGLEKGGTVNTKTVRCRFVSRQRARLTSFDDCHVEGNRAWCSCGAIAANDLAGDEERLDIFNEVLISTAAAALLVATEWTIAIRSSICSFAERTAEDNEGRLYPNWTRALFNTYKPRRRRPALCAVLRPAKMSNESVGKPAPTST